MGTQIIGAGSTIKQFGPALDSVEARWYAVYTRAQHEKQVAKQLAERDIANYLPMYESVHRWKDRWKKVELPLFAGYIFVHIPLQRRLDVLRIPSVVRLVGFNGAPTAIPEEEIESLRRALEAGVRAEPHPFWPVGRRVRITAGPLAGREGTLKRWKGVRVVLSVELIQRSVLVDMEAAGLEPLGKKSNFASA